MDSIAQIDDICDRFEEAWLAGTPQSIEAVVASADAEIRHSLLKELLRLEIEYRRQQKHSVTVNEYRARFPEMDAWLASLFAVQTTRGRTVQLSVIAGPHLGRQFAFDRHETFLLGRARDVHCSLPEKDAYLSRHHFLIEVNPPMCRLVDLSSHNGTRVNGERVQVADLKNGDRIEVGVTHLLVAIPFQEDSVDHLAGTIKPIVRESTPEVAPNIPGLRILGKLGQGGMGIVYRAVCESTARRSL